MRARSSRSRVTPSCRARLALARRLLLGAQPLAGGVGDGHDRGDDDEPRDHRVAARARDEHQDGPRPRAPHHRPRAARRDDRERDHEQEDEGPRVAELVLHARGREDQPGHVRHRREAPGDQRARGEQDDADHGGGHHDDREHVPARRRPHDLVDRDRAPQEGDGDEQPGRQDPQAAAPVRRVVAAHDGSAQRRHDRADGAPDPRENPVRHGGKAR
jgi:hypothetical protein